MYVNFLKLENCITKNIDQSKLILQTEYNTARFLLKPKTIVIDHAPSYLN